MDYSTIISLCRLCATQNIDINLTENLSSIEIPERRNLLALVNKYLNIAITDQESLPQKFCAECIQKLHAFDTFSRRCHEVQEMFNSLSDGGHVADELIKSLLENNRLDHEYKGSDRSRSNSKTINDNVDSSDDENISLAKRLDRKCANASNEKQKRCRPKRSNRKVPPLRIKAVKQENITNTSNGRRTRDSSNTQYEIRDEPVNNTNLIKEPKKNNFDAENDSDEDEYIDNVSDESYTCGDEAKDQQKVYRKNPFAIFEFKCHICQEVFKNFSILKRHCKKEHASLAFVNCVCGKQLRARTAIVEHRRKHTGTSLFKCDTCSKTFNRRSLMCLHMISHMPKDEQPYVCCKCAKRFHTASLLKKHEKVHLPEEERFLDECHICQKKFTSKSAVNAHLRAVHYGEKPFVCEHCGNSFSSKAILTDHLTTHSSYAPWPCEVCGRNFKSKYRLNVHMDMHRSVKYRCPHCPMELSTRRTLRMHLLVHKEEKAYVCEVCMKAFRRSKDLKNHSNLHTGRRPYKCEFCERTFANGSNCRAHKLRMHPEELGVEKNTRSYSCTQRNVTVSNVRDSNNLDSTVCATTAATGILQNECITTVHDANRIKSLTTFSDVMRNPPTIDYMKYENKYEFPTTTATSQDLEYSMEYARYTVQRL